METKISSINEMKGSFLEFSTDIVALPSGDVAQRDFVKHPGGVCIVCNVDGKMLCVKQFRYSVGDFTIEIPAGKLDKNEDHKVAINRELIEETGYEAKNLEYMGPFITTPGFSDEVIHMYYSDEVVVSNNPKGYKQDDDEDIEVMLLSSDELLLLLQEYKLGDYKTAFGFLYFLSRIGK
ncbi:MAG: NUDIX hydrolase [Mycoplasmatales bacterium]